MHLPDLHCLTCRLYGKNGLCTGTQATDARTSFPAASFHHTDPCAMWCSPSVTLRPCQSSTPACCNANAPVVPVFQSDGPSPTSRCWQIREGSAKSTYHFASLRLIQPPWCAGHTHVEHSTHDTSSHILKTGHIFRHFASDSEEADKIKYPIRTPDHVYVYNGPLAVTVTRLKVRHLYLHATTGPCFLVTCETYAVVCRN